MAGAANLGWSGELEERGGRAVAARGGPGCAYRCAPDWCPRPRRGLASPGTRTSDTHLPVSPRLPQPRAGVGGGAPSAGGHRGPRTESPPEHKQPWPASGRGTEPWPGRRAGVPRKNSLGSEGHSARKREAAMAGKNLQYSELFVIRHKAAVTFHKGGPCLGGAGRFCAWFQSLRLVSHFQDLNLLSQSFPQLLCPLSLFRAI